MTEEAKAHKTTTLMVRAAPAELDAGADIVIKFRVACPEKCNLLGGKVRIADAEGAVVKEVELTSFHEAANDTDEFVVKAPSKPGEYAWTAVFEAPDGDQVDGATARPETGRPSTPATCPANYTGCAGGAREDAPSPVRLSGAQEHERILHEESAVPFSFVVKPHTTSMAVWDVPSPIVFNARFKIKVGARCSAECALVGREVTIYNHAGAQVATGSLGDVPWSDSGALYWAEVELAAPGTEGYYQWTAKLPKPELDLPHEGAAYSFAFVTARPPEHVVTVEVIDERDKTPLKHALVTLHSSGTPYRTRADDMGVARLNVPKGVYQLYVLTNDYKELETTVDVAGDVQVKAEMIYWPVGRL